MIATKKRNILLAVLLMPLLLWAGKEVSVPNGDRPAKVIETKSGADDLELLPNTWFLH